MPILQNRKTLWSYERNANVASGGTVVLNNFQFSGKAGAHELSLRFGLSDVTAWGAGSFFLILHNGRELLQVDDQLADLLRPVSIPVELTGKDTLTISFYNGSGAAIEVSAVVRVDAA